MIILALRQQMPAEHSELASHGHRGDLMAAPGADAHEKSMQWTGRLSRCPGRLDQHGARVTAADLADATVMGGSQSRLPHPRVQPEIAHQLLWLLNRSMLPIAATIPAATVKFTPVIVINLLTAGSSIASCAISRSRRPGPPQAGQVHGRADRSQLAHRPATVERPTTSCREH